MGSRAVYSEGAAEKTFGNPNIINQDRIWIEQWYHVPGTGEGGRNAEAQVPMQRLSFLYAAGGYLPPETFNLVIQIPVDRRVWESAWYHYYTALDDENQLMFTLLSPRGKMQPWTLSIGALWLGGSSSFEIFQKTPTPAVLLPCHAQQDGRAQGNWLHLNSDIYFLCYITFVLECMTSDLKRVVVWDEILFYLCTEVHLQYQDQLLESFLLQRAGTMAWAKDRSWALPRPKKEL